MHLAHQLRRIGRRNADERHGSRDAEVSPEVIRGVIRIMTADEPALTTITVDGELAGDNIQTVETICDQARSNGKPTWLLLRDVTVVGEDGQALLRRLATRGVRLKASRIYTSYIVGSIQPDALPRIRR